jgi:hypothetical protein
MYRTYIMKLWLTTLVVTPIAFICLILLIDPDMLALYPVMKLLAFVIFIGFVLSIPTLLLVGFLSQLLEKKIKSTKNLKVVAILISILGVAITFFLLFDPDSFDQSEFNWGLTLAILYSLSIAVFGNAFKLRPFD